MINGLFEKIVVFNKDRLTVEGDMSGEVYVPLIVIPADIGHDISISVV